MTRFSTEVRTRISLFWGQVLPANGVSNTLSILFSGARLVDVIHGPVHVDISSEPISFVMPARYLPLIWCCSDRGARDHYINLGIGIPGVETKYTIETYRFAVCLAPSKYLVSLMIPIVGESRVTGSGTSHEVMRDVSFPWFMGQKSF